MLNKNINPKESVLHIGVVQSHHQMSDHSSEFSIKQLYLPAETGQIARQISLLLLLVNEQKRQSGEYKCPATRVRTWQQNHLHGMRRHLGVS